MSKVEFDELLRQRFDSEQLEADPAPSWERLAALLPPATPVVPIVKKRRLLPYISAAAASVAAIITVAWMFNNQNKSIQQPRAVASHESNKPAPTYTPQIETIQATNPVKDAIASRPGHGSNAHSGSGSTKILNNSWNRATSGIPYNKPISADAIINTGETTSNVGAQENVIVQQIESPTQPTNHLNTNEDNFTFKTPELIAANNHSADNLTSIGLGGGINYGTMNTGYTLGLNARRYVSERVFVDGTVAVLMNKSSEGTLNYTGNFMADQSMAANENTRARPSAENYYYPAQGLYYIQFNPSIGYKIGKTVSMSVGGDFQQMLQNSRNNETVLFSSDGEAKLFPTFDVGVTGKTEVSITPSIQAGVLYREGVNNLIRNESQYVNRRYVQVQVKYSLPIK
jgi:hypothetical protein